MDIGEAVSRARGLNKPGIWKYTPGFVARWRIRKRKDVSGLNGARARRLEEYVKVKGLSGQMENLLADNVGLVHENAGLKTRDAEMERLYGAAKGALAANEEVERMRKTIMCLRLVGSASVDGNLTKEEKAAINHLVKGGDVNVGLVEMVGKLEEKVFDLVERNKKMGLNLIVGNVAAACHGARLDRVPVMLYQNEEILYGTDKMEEMIGSGYLLEESLRGNEELGVALSRNKKFSMEYANGRLFFVPEKVGGSSVAIAYYVPNGGKRKMRVYGKFGMKAVNTIYKTLQHLEKAGIGIGNGTE